MSKRVMFVCSDHGTEGQSGDTSPTPAKSHIDWNRYPAPSAAITQAALSTNGQDLKRFLEEVSQP